MTDKIELKSFLYYALGSCSTSEGGIVTHAITFRNGEPANEPLICRDLAEPDNISTIVRLNRSDIDRWDRKKEYKIRKCFSCPNKIIFHEFWISNKNEMPLDQLEKIWESPHIELFCCSCFEKEKGKEQIQAKEYRLINKSKRICNKFGFDLIHDKNREEDEGC